MDVTPPTMLRRLGIALAGVAVAALTGAACALSFDDLRALAIHGEARPDLAFLYPAGFDALLVVALIGVLLLRPARLLVRTQAALVLIVLILAAAAVNVATTVRFSFDVRQAALGVAVAPWVMLALGLWLWLLLIKHVQARRTPDEADDGTAEQDLVPFTGRPTPPAQEPHSVSEGVTRWAVSPAQNASQDPVPAPREPEPAADTVEIPRPTPAQEEPDPREEPHPRHEVSEAVHTWQAGGQPWQPDRTEPTPDQAVPELPDPAHDATQADDEPPVAPQPRQEQPEVSQPDQPTHEEPQTTDAGAQEIDGGAQPAHVEPEPAVQEQEQEPAPEPAEEPKPVRWGDRKKPADVLVHPRIPERDKDTQPLRVVTSEPSENPDPEHGPEVADPSEPRHAAEDAPSGRLRSTPLPPDTPDE